MMEQTILLASAYLAPVQYYAKLYGGTTCYVEQFDHYVKQTYRNRCVIAASDGPLALTIPTERTESPKCLMKDVRISDHGKWRHLHWTALVSAYRTSPYFEYYQDDFRPFYERRYEFLYDFNEALCDTVCRLLDLQPDLRRTEAYQPEAGEGVLDCRELIHPKRPYADDTRFAPQPYYQVFDRRLGFLPNLSIVDLLFNMGPEGLLVLRDSVRRP